MPGLLASPDLAAPRQRNSVLRGGMRSRCRPLSLDLDKVRAKFADRAGLPSSR